MGHCGVGWPPPITLGRLQPIDSGSSDETSRTGRTTTTSVGHRHTDRARDSGLNVTALCALVRPGPASYDWHAGGGPSSQRGAARRAMLHCEKLV